jgi:serine/threonine protein kinase
MQSSRGLLQPGAVVADKYVISRLIGRGGMGAVYVVEHRVTGKRLALKCLLPEHLEHPEFVERFLREAQAAGRIEHRNVVDVFDVGREGELIYIVMELLDGKPLAELLRAGNLSLEETLQIMLRAMDGVAAAHAVGIVHRDLKPDNILVCVGQSGRLDDPRVLDFGISKLEDDVSKPLTKSGVMLGTPYYMAFEQINSQRDLDQRVDVYAMGVILYESMAGHVPYVAESVGALAIRMMSGPPVPLGQLRPELPPGLADVVMRSVARDRDQRFPTMNALIEALRPYAPESASLFVPRGQGTPLGPARASQPMAIDATMPAMPSPLPPHHTPRASVREPGPLPTPTGEARLRLHRADEGRTPSVDSSSRNVLWAVAVGLLGLIIVVSVFFALSADDEPSEPSAPPPVPEPAPRAEEKPSSLPEPKAEPPASKAEPAAVDEPKSAPVEASPAEPAGVEEERAAPAAKGKARRAKKGKKGAQAVEEPAEPEEYVPAGTGTEPAPAAKVEPAKVEPAKVEPAKVEPAKVEPAPAAPEPAPEPPKAEAPAEPAPEAQ